MPVGGLRITLIFSRNNIVLDEVISALEIVTQTFRKVRRAEFADGSRLNLAHSFACETERTAHFLERVILIRYRCHSVNATPELHAD